MKKNYNFKIRLYDVFSPANVGALDNDWPSAKSIQIRFSNFFARYFLKCLPFASRLLVHVSLMVHDAEGQVTDLQGQACDHSICLYSGSTRPYGWQPYWFQKTNSSRYNQESRRTTHTIGNSESEFRERQRSWCSIAKWKLPTANPREIYSWLKRFQEISGKEVWEADLYWFGGGSVIIQSSDACRGTRSVCVPE